jgi:hypothetical protein
MLPRRQQDWIIVVLRVPEVLKVLRVRVLRVLARFEAVGAGLRARATRAVG